MDKCEKLKYKVGDLFAIGNNLGIIVEINIKKLPHSYKMYWYSINNKSFYWWSERSFGGWKKLNK